MAAAVCIAPGNANDSRMASVTTVVPLDCTVRLSDTTLVASRETVGVTSEFCNNGTGYRLIATPTGNVTGSRLIVDGREIRLEAGIDVVLASEPQAAIRERAISFVAHSDDASGELSVRVETR
jgi:hypothetical protein